ncbi:MAG TPA: ARMT1-like domain-containing protein [Syntrophales bacterium]|nr:ARMT1-like domain-containing protein [Syntrophales bacterium]
MKIYLDCFPCLMRQALEASRLSGADEDTQREVVHRVMNKLFEISEGETPPQIGSMIHRTISTVTGKCDPYREIKDLHNKQMLDLEDKLAGLIDDSLSPLSDALKLAAVGNLIDMGPERRWNSMEDIFRDFTKRDATYFDYASFEKSLGQAGTLLYLGDNAGEIVLDKILIGVLLRETKLDITYAVRGGPVINDATMEDARFVGMTDMVRVIDTGIDFPGVMPTACSDEFLGYFNGADMILSKGQGNYESLSEEDKNIFFLLQTKCHVVAEKIGCALGDIVLKSRHRYLKDI